MALKQNSDTPENLRQAIQSVRDAIDGISTPLPRGLECMLQMEGLIEDFHVSLPLADFSPFDGLTSGADIEMGKQSHNIDTQRNKADEHRADNYQANRVMPDGRAEGCSRNHCPGNISGITDKDRRAPLEPYSIAPDVRLETPAEVNNKQVREKLGSGGGKTIIPTSVSAMESIPGSFTPSPIQNRKQNFDAVENTLVAVDKLVDLILDEEHKSRAEQVHTDHENVECDQERKSKDERLKTESISAITPSGAVQKDKVSGHTGRGSHSQKENRQTGSFHGGIEEPVPLPGKSAFSTRPVEGNTVNLRRSEGSRTLSTCLTKVGRMADEILRLPAKSSKADANIVRTPNRSSRVKNPGSALAGTVLNAGDFDGKPDMKNQQPKENFLSNKVNNVTEVVLSNSMSAGSLDKDAITALVNDVLVEQARRHGVDLS